MPRPKAALRVIILTDPLGYLEPCGCQQRPLGGVDKLAATVKKARAEGVPVLALAAGDLTFGSAIHGDDALSARTEEMWRAETLIDAWNSLGVTAVTPGALDFAHGIESQRALAKRAKFPFVAENLSLGDATLDSVVKARVFDVGPTKVGVFGIVAPNAAIDAAVRVDADLRAISQRAVTALRDQGAKVVIALTAGDRRAARDVATAGPDFVVIGGLDAEEPVPPFRQGETTLLHAGRQGQRVLTLDLGLSQSGAFQDVSEWTRQVARAEVVKRVKELEARIRDWEQDPRTKPADLAAQRARLATLHRERDQAPTLRYDGRWFSAAIVDLAPEIQGDPEIAVRMDAVDKRINEHNRDALKDRLPKPAKAGSPTYIGSESCKSCHGAAYDWWRTTKHGHAYATLEKLNKQFSLACVGCHVTGYNEPGGSTVTHTETLKDVGCENCHGPSSLHNLKPKDAGLVHRDTPEATCRACHNQEHSARFQYDAFRSLLIVPGHGLPAVKSNDPK